MDEPVSRPGTLRHHNFNGRDLTPLSDVVTIPDAHQPGAVLGGQFLGAILMGQERACDRECRPIFRECNLF